MSSITVKNIPEEVHQKLKQKAVYNHRSLNNEILACLEASVKVRQLDPELFLSRARKYRSKITGNLTEEALQQFKSEGRL